MPPPLRGAPALPSLWPSRRCTIRGPSGIRASSDCICRRRSSYRDRSVPCVGRSSSRRNSLAHPSTIIAMPNTCASRARADGCSQLEPLRLIGTHARREDASYSWSVCSMQCEREHILFRLYHVLCWTRAREGDSRDG